MTADQLAKVLGISRPWLFRIKKQFSKESPRGFDDVEAWKAFLVSTKTKARTKPFRTTAKASESTLELSDIARLTRNRADKVQLENTILTIEVEATRRQVVRQEEVIAIFAQLATVVRGRLMKMKNDLPSALLGLDAPAIDEVVGDKMEHVLSSFRLPEDFFNSKGLV